MSQTDPVEYGRNAVPDPFHILKVIVCPPNIGTTNDPMNRPEPVPFMSYRVSLMKTLIYEVGFAVDPETEYVMEYSPAFEDGMVVTNVLVRNPPESNTTVFHGTSEYTDVGKLADVPVMVIPVRIRAS